MVCSEFTCRACKTQVWFSQCQIDNWKYWMPPRTKIPKNWICETDLHKRNRRDLPNQCHWWFYWNWIRNWVFTFSLVTNSSVTDSLSVLHWSMRFKRTLKSCYDQWNQILYGKTIRKCKSTLKQTADLSIIWPCVFHLKSPPAKDHSQFIWPYNFVGNI